MATRLMTCLQAAPLHHCFLVIHIYLDCQSAGMLLLTRLFIPSLLWCAVPTAAHYSPVWPPAKMLHNLFLIAPSILRFVVIIITNCCRSNLPHKETLPGNVSLPQLRLQSGKPISIMTFNTFPWQLAAPAIEEYEDSTDCHVIMWLSQLLR